MSCISPITQDTEGGRVARLLAASQACVAATALAKARALRSSCGTVACRDRQAAAAPAFVPASSALLERTVRDCYSSVPAKEGCVPESVRIARAAQCSLDQAQDPFNRETRFVEFRGPFIPPVCPPIPQEALNANIPRQSFASCPLPNRPDNPVLPI
jgi:hypothetical protein